MSEILYAFLIVPIFFIIVMAFIFSSALTEIENLQERIDCPYPALSGLWNDTGVITLSNYTYNYEAVNLNTLTLTCTGIHTMDGYDYQFGIFTIQPFFSNGTGFDFGVPMGWAFYVGDYLSEATVNKLTAYVEMIALFVNAPAQVAGMDWYTYVNIVLIAFIILGGVMVIKPF